MFHFGLFSTFMPYLIIAVIYFCGLVSYSAEKINRERTEQTAEAYRNHTIESDIFSEGVCFKKYAYGYKQTAKASYRNYEKIFSKSISEEFTETYIPQYIEGNNYTYSLFLRPPPAVS